MHPKAAAAIAHSPFIVWPRGPAPRASRLPSATNAPSRRRDADSMHRTTRSPAIPMGAGRGRYATQRAPPPAFVVRCVLHLAERLNGFGCDPAAPRSAYRNAPCRHSSSPPRQPCGLPGRPTGLIASTSRPNRANVRDTNARFDSSAFSNGCSRGPALVKISSPSRSICSRQLSARSSAAQASVNSSRPPLSGI